VAAGAVLFAVISVSAMVARLVWGRLADRGGGLCRRNTLRDVGIVTVIGGLAYWLVAPMGAWAQIAVMFVYAFGAMGANGILYLIAGELTGPARAGQAVGLISMSLFGVGGLVSPLLGLQADHFGFRSLWLTGAACGVVSTILTLGLPEDAPHDEIGAKIQHRSA
jgi:MFS family permease